MQDKVNVDMRIHKSLMYTRSMLSFLWVCLTSHWGPHAKGFCLRDKYEAKMTSKMTMQKAACLHPYLLYDIRYCHTYPNDLNESSTSFTSFMMKATIAAAKPNVIILLSRNSKSCIYITNN